jgi:hypothetical protein
VIAPVAAEPSLPFGGASDLHLSETEADALRRRADVHVMALRFKGDPACRPERIAALRDLVGPDRLTAIELDDAHKNPSGNAFPHAVLTRDLIHEDGQPTLAAAKQVLSFLQDRLAGAA